MSIDNLKDLFEEELKDLYNAEGQILKALPKLIRAARSRELRDALQNHLQETEQQKQRLERIFTDLGLPAKGKNCEGMKGIIEEGDSMVEEAGEKVIDACIIAAAQKVEHYEWASYGTVRTYADMLGHEDAVELLQESLDEEQAADETLTKLAEAFANEQALSGAEGEEDEAGARSSEESEEEEETVGARGRAKQSTGSSQGTSASRRRDREGKAAPKSKSTR
jgi:ferritin-like metal-binding protein YciE